MKLEEFIQRVQRRWIAWRIAEFAAIGAAIAAGIGFFIVAILMWQSQAAIIPAMILLCIGAAAGAIWALIHRPTFLQTAIEADKQLNLHDLLSTAIRIETSDEAFASVVIAQAEKTCRGISPNELILRRMGSRAWGGIGIFAALLLTLAMMSGQPIVSEAKSAIEMQQAKNTSVENKTEQASAKFAESQIQNNKIKEEQTRSDFGNSSSANHRSANDAVKNNSAGSTAARSNDARAESLEKIAGKNVTSENSQGMPSAGNGNESLNPMKSDALIASPGASAGLSKSIPPWQAGNWSADRAAAERDIQANKIPDAYRDLVRDYFNLPAR